MLCWSFRRALCIFSDTPLFGMAIMYVWDFARCANPKASVRTPECCRIYYRVWGRVRSKRRKGMAKVIARIVHVEAEVRETRRCV